MKSQIKYQVYLPGGKRPSWSYKTDKQFYLRLRQAAMLRSLGKVYVHLLTRDKWYVVNLNPEMNILWKSAELSQSPIL